MRTQIFLLSFLIGSVFGWFRDEYVREKVFPLAAAAYSDDPEACVEKIFKNATVRTKVTRLCGNGYVEPEDCFAYTGVAHDEKVIFISFRGTNGIIQLIYEARRTVFRNKIPTQAGGNVSEYFYSVYRSILDTGLAREVLQLRHDHPDYDIIVTGHSLGGAMASIAAFDLVTFAKVDAEKVKLVTFGQPRTGDREFAEVHDELIPHAYRITHARDVVPHVPPLNFQGYYHHATEVWYNNKMLPGDGYIICEELESNNCSNRNYVNHSVLAHLYYYNILVSDFGIAGCPADLKNVRRLG
ncbi:unnamed protein product [Bursaphelenchus xylophilus]|uniref:(pine wood nematode) hypothetical protein n=1 Tax=Bursaphelenchus xylophilus TaxID=6326 RepID=A0A1I7RI68_BURXY|nr:unnamed protein product [Bursaphelenchus xylophilus]CAG9115119.1 unnamed protein product [Bursaphelenchus xylophilus]